MKTITYMFLFCVLVFSSCKKHDMPKDDETTENEMPVFYAKCELDGVALTMTAGKNNYRMNSSYYLDTNNVYVYKAELKQNSCDKACGYSLVFLINDDKTSGTNDKPNVNTALQPREYIFNDKNIKPMFYQAKFTPVEALSSYGTCKWKIGDNLSCTDMEAVATLQADKTYSVNYFLNNSGKRCSAEHTNMFKIGNPLQVTVNADRQTIDWTMPRLIYNFSCKATGKAPYSYLWDFGDGTADAISYEATPKHYYANEGNYNASLRLIDANNDTCFSYYRVPVTYNDDFCNPNFTAQFTPVPNTKAYSGVTVLLIDSNGNIHSSKDLAQSADSYIEVTGVENYKENENGEPTKKLKIKFNCTVTDGANQYLISNGEAVLAVSY